METLSKLSMMIAAVIHGGGADSGMEWLLAILAVPLIIVAVAYFIEGDEKPGSGDQTGKVKQ